MSQGFKLRYDQMREEDSSEPDISSAEPEAGKIYRAVGHARSLCLVWPDNTRMFFNYAYLVSGTFNDHNEQNSINLYFSSHVVQISGFGLEALFMALLEHTPRLIVAIEERYVLDNPTGEATVIKISVEEKK